MKIVIIFFTLITTIFATTLIDGNYSVTENVIKGKKWRTKVELEIKNNKIKWINVDMVNKDGLLMSQNKKNLQMILKNTDGIDPYIELPKEYMQKLKTVDNYKMSKVDTIVGATVISNKFNKMIKFLLKKSEEGKTGKFKGWFH